MKTPLAAAESLEVGSLGVCHLKRVWTRSVEPARSQDGPGAAMEWMADKVLFSGLGLALEQTVQYLFRERPVFEQFENWVLELNGGAIESERIERINAALKGEPTPESAQKRIAEIEQHENVLSAGDLQFWAENGYVVVHDAVPMESLQGAEKALWNWLKKDPDNPDSWYAGLSGIMVPLYHHPALKANRQSKRLHKAFSQLLGTADLWVSTDRTGFNPPERPGFAFPGPHLHWDISLAPPIPFDLGGLLYLTDTLPDQGAFTCVPGFHRRVQAWLQSLPPRTDPRQQNLQQLGPVPIPGKAGDLLIWRQELPHGSSPNRAQRPRMVQYISMFKAEQVPERPWL